jgi:hypothetical protein
MSTVAQRLNGSDSICVGAVGVTGKHSGAQQVVFRRAILTP